MNRIDAVIFDLGGVLINIDFSRCLSEWARLSGKSYAQIHERYEVDAAYKQHECGQIDTPAYFESLRSSLRIDLTDQQFLIGWRALILEPVPGIQGLLEQISQSTRIAMFSNTNGAHFDWVRNRYPELPAAFDCCYLSYELGLRKPDVPAFQAVLDDLNVAPANTLFFDDTSENILAAREIGINAIQIFQLQDLKAGLNEHGILPRQSAD